MRSHASHEERIPALHLEVCDEEGRVVDTVTVRDLGATFGDDASARYRVAYRRARTGH